MKPLFWVGLLLLVFGITSFFVPIPSRDRQSVEVGEMSLSVETKSQNKLPPLVSGLVVLGGVALLIVGRKRA
jgi:uncharacterized membrane protein